MSNKLCAPFGLTTCMGFGESGAGPHPAHALITANVHPNKHYPRARIQLTAVYGNAGGGKYDGTEESVLLVLTAEEALQLAQQIIDAAEAVASVLRTTSGVAKEAG